jgi:plastocyanin
MKRPETTCDSSLRRRHPLFVLVGLLALFALATGCGSGSDSGGTGAAPSASGTPAPSGTSGSSAAPSGGTMVEIKDFMFSPMSLTVPVGGTVTWKFDDSTQHTVTADDKSFASTPMSNGQTFTHTFTTAGTVPYHCSIHPNMTATIVVK